MTDRQIEQMLNQAIDGNCRRDFGDVISRLNSSANIPMPVAENVNSSGGFFAKPAAKVLAACAAVVLATTIGISVLVATIDLFAGDGAVAYDAEVMQDVGEPSQSTGSDSEFEASASEGKNKEDYEDADYYYFVYIDGEWLCYPKHFETD